jgi:hypothetical protein
MISYLLVILAAFCNAVMDTLIHHHDTSVFKNYKTGFFADALTVSWKNKYIDGEPIKGHKKLFWFINVPDTFTDGWHFCKSTMIVALILAIVLYNPLFGIWIDFIALGFAWNATFNFFYNVILRK